MVVWCHGGAEYLDADELAVLVDVENHCVVYVELAEGSFLRSDLHVSGGGFGVVSESHSLSLT